MSQLKSSPCDAIRSTKVCHHPLLHQFSNQTGKAKGKVSTDVSQNHSGNVHKAMQTPRSRNETSQFSLLDTYFIFCLPLAFCPHLFHSWSCGNSIVFPLVHILTSFRKPPAGSILKTLWWLTRACRMFSLKPILSSLFDF